MSAVRSLSVETDDGPRHALLRDPARVPGSTRRPAVILLHGAGGSSKLALENTGWAAVADREGLLLAYPDGTRRDPGRPPMFLQNPQAWNDGSGRGHTARTGVDDAAFLSALMDRLIQDEQADPARIYMAGFSNGGAMTFRAGAELGARIAAIGPVAGHCWVDPERLARPVPALMIFGALDPLNPPDGGEVTTPWGKVERHPPVVQSFDRWRALCGCAGEPIVDHSMPGVHRRVAAGCPGGSEVECLVVEDLGHHWPGGPRLLPPWIAGPASRRIDGAEVLWDFFRRHRIG